MKKFLFVLTLVDVTATSLLSQTDSLAYKKGLEAITVRAVKGKLDFLASDWTEGRGTGLRGE